MLLWSFESSQMKNSGEKLKSLVGGEFESVFFSSPYAVILIDYKTLTYLHVSWDNRRRETWMRDFRRKKFGSFFEKWWWRWCKFNTPKVNIIKWKESSSKSHEKNLSSISTRITFLKLVAAFTVRASEIERKLTCRWLSSVQQWENKLFPLLIYVSSTMAIDSFPSLIFTLNTHQFRSSYFHRINNS